MVDNGTGDYTYSFTNNISYSGEYFMYATFGVGRLENNNSFNHMGFTTLQELVIALLKITGIVEVLMRELIIKLMET